MKRLLILLLCMALGVPGYGITIQVTEDYWVTGDLGDIEHLGDQYVSFWIDPYPVLTRDWLFDVSMAPIGGSGTATVFLYASNINEGVSDYLWININGWMTTLDITMPGDYTSIINDTQATFKLQSHAFDSSHLIVGTNTLRITSDGGMGFAYDDFEVTDITIDYTPIVPINSEKPIWQNETDRMITPSDEVSLDFRFKNNSSMTLHNVKLSFQSNTNLISLEKGSMDIGEVDPEVEFGGTNSIIIAGVDNDEIMSEIINTSGTGELLLTYSIDVTVQYDSDWQEFTLTPTNENGDTLAIQYPDFSLLAGTDPSATQSEKNFYTGGDASYHHPSDNLVRKYAVEGARYRSGNIYGLFPDTPQEITDNVYNYVHELLDPKHDPDSLYNDITILGWVENGLLSIDKPYADPYIGGHMCIEHAYLFSSLVRALGLSSREVTTALGTGIHQIGPVVWDIEYGYQEAAVQVWYTSDWRFYDLYIYSTGTTNIDEYLQGWFAYRSWHAFNEQPNGHDFRIRTSDGRPVDESQWRNLKDNHREGLIIIGHSPISILITDEYGRRVGSVDGVVKEIPGAIYIPPNSKGYTDASDPSSVVDLNELIFIPNTGGMNKYLLTVTGSGEGVYTTTFSILGAAQINDVSSHTGEIVEGATYVYSASISPEGVLTIKPDPVGELDHLKDYINSLPNDVFKNESGNMKRVLHNKIDEIVEKFNTGEYQDAINKLEKDIRAKMDGDSTAEDWVIDPEAQHNLCIIIDHIIGNIQTLQGE